MKINIERPTQTQLESLGVTQWSIWEKEASSFQWEYDDEEVCYILEGDVIVTPESDAPVHIQPGDLVTFPKGMVCHWQINKAIKKHFIFR